MVDLKIVSQQLAELLYLEKPESKKNKTTGEEGKPLTFKELPEDRQAFYLERAKININHLSKLNVELVKAGSCDKQRMDDVKMLEIIIGILTAELSKLQHPKNLMQFMTKDVLHNIAYKLLNPASQNG